MGYKVDINTNDSMNYNSFDPEAMAYVKNMFPEAYNSKGFTHGRNLGKGDIRTKWGMLEDGRRFWHVVQNVDKHLEKARFMREMEKRFSEHTPMPEGVGIMIYTMPYVLRDILEKAPYHICFKTYNDDAPMKRRLYYAMATTYKAFLCTNKNIMKLL